MIKSKYTKGGRVTEITPDTYPSIRMKKITYLKEDWLGRLKKDCEVEDVQFYDKESDGWINAWLEPTEYEVRMSEKTYHF